MRNQKYYDTVGLIGGGPPQDIPKVLNPTVISYKTGFKIPPINYSLQYLVLHRFNPPVKYNLPPNSLVEADTLESYVFDAFSKVTCQQAAIIYRLTGLDFGPEIMTKTQYCGKFFLASFKDIAQTFTKEPYFLSLAKLGSDDTYVSFSVPVEKKN